MNGTTTPHRAPTQTELAAPAKGTAPLPIGHALDTPPDEPRPDFSVSTRPSQALAGLVWTAQLPDGQEDAVWSALWEGQHATDSAQLAALLPATAWTPALRFEAWLAYTLGLDGFVPLLDPETHADVLRRGPIAPHTGAADGVPFLDALAPFEGQHGLEGYVLHQASGHVLRAFVEGLPQAGFDLPVLVPMTTPGAS